MFKPTNPRQLNQGYSSDSTMDTMETMETTRPQSPSPYDLIILQQVALVNQDCITQKFSYGIHCKTTRRLSLGDFPIPATPVPRLCLTPSDSYDSRNDLCLTSPPRPQTCPLPEIEDIKSWEPMGQRANRSSVT